MIPVIIPDGYAVRRELYGDGVLRLVLVDGNNAIQYCLPEDSFLIEERDAEKLMHFLWPGWGEGRSS